MEKLIAYVDGGCNNRIHSGAYGSFAIFGKDSLIKSETFLLDVKTSNEAEYMSLIYLLKYILSYKNYNKYEWRIFSDSKLLVNQVGGNWKCNAKNLKGFNHSAKSLLHRIENIKLIWTERKKIVSILGH